MSLWMLYIIIVLVPSISSAATGILIAGFIIGVIAISIGPVVFMEMENEFVATAKTFIKPYIYIMGISAIICVVAPDREDMAYMVGGYFVTNVEQVEKLPDNLVNAANRYLEDYGNKDSDQ